jgi:serine/threonine protein kinase
VAYCINPWCRVRLNSDNAENCSACGSPLLIYNRFKLLRPLFPLEQPRPTDIYEALDTTGSWELEPGSIKILKVLKVWNTEGSEHLRLFEREAETLQSLKNSCIPYCDPDDFFCISLENGPEFLYCLAMEKFEGLNLDDWIKQHGSISQEVAIDWILQLAAILSFIHANGIIHRDIKPHNIIVRPDGKLALIDFSGARNFTETYLAKLGFGRSNFELTNIFTPFFAAPEQLNGKALPQSDFYSLGRTIIVGLTGKYFHELPFNRETGAVIWRKSVQNVDPPILRFIDELVSPSLSVRPKTADEILEFITSVLPRKLRWYRVRRNKWLRFLAILPVGLVMVGLLKAWMLFGASQSLRESTDATNSGRYPEAMAQLQWSIRLAPTASAYLHLGYVCKITGDILCAERNYKKALALDPTSVAAYQNLGVLYEDEGDLEKAATTYKQSISASKDLEPVSMINLARVYLLQKNIVGAQTLITQVTPLSDKNPYIQSRLFKTKAWGYFIKDKFLLAKNAIDQAIKLDGTYASAYCLSAQIQEALKLDADRQWIQCMTIESEDSHFPEVRQWRSTFIKRALSQPH